MDGQYAGVAAVLAAVEIVVAVEDEMAVQVLFAQVDVYKRQVYYQFVSGETTFYRRLPDTKKEEVETSSFLL